jgi:hypothetical protein
LVLFWSWSPQAGRLAADDETISEDGPCPDDRW